MPLLFAPTIGAAPTAQYLLLWVCRPACRTTGELTLGNLIGTTAPPLRPLFLLSCRSRSPNAPLVCLSKASLSEEYYAKRSEAKT
jgi:hypothetical protein